MRGGKFMCEKPVLAIILGQRAEVFRVILKELQEKLNVEIIGTVSESELAGILNEHAGAAIFLDSFKIGVFRRIIRRFPATPGVGITGDAKNAQKLVHLGIFDVVLETDPEWRLRLAVRNAIKISALLELENALNINKAELERMIAIAAGSAGIVHEARNLLYGVAGMLTFEREKSREKRSKRILLRAVNAINSLSVLLGQVLSREAMGRAKRMKGVQVDKIACQITDLLASSFKLAGVTLERYIDMGIPTIHAWPAGIASAILELLTNSVKACGPGDCVRLKVVKDGSDILVEITDTAGRMEREKGIKSVGNKCPQTMLEKKGSGLGLALVERVARAHGSRIEEQASCGIGSVYRLRLPVNRSARKVRQRV
jgi:signal transduction histidine kinase